MGLLATDIVCLQSQFLNATYDEYKAAYDVLSACGLLTVDNLNLPVAKYDPEEYYKSLINNQDKRFQDLKILNLLKELNEE